MIFHHFILVMFQEKNVCFQMGMLKAVCFAVLEIDFYFLFFLRFRLEI